ncbi:hypothetical protein FHS83_003469 [Rhizomicrobium palustre]|uniref:Uncharacterized protein n=1 Tax=Rhizomicrobium palustre TaxID=189966 RepID=A0A846N4M6_9PROT|nr:hypothetical protein [Rhizomicrobium palustre]NIK90151.1 hypothetical protein [Rhizomicrobium palustre]
MRAFLIASVLFLAGAFAATDPMATRYGNTTIALDPDGSTTRLFYRADQSFVAKQTNWQSDGHWAFESGKLCLTYKITRPGVGDKECVSSEPHAIGDVWIHGIHHVTLVQGEALKDTPEVLAALAAASRVGNTIIAKDPDGTETRLYWRPDHSFSATRPGWQTEGSWRVQGASLILHYNIPRPNMGSYEEMKNATPRKVGEVWGMADRQVTLVAGNQLKAP